MVGPFRPPKGSFTHIFVTVNKFTKWNKAKPIASIMTAKEVEFITDITERFRDMIPSLRTMEHSSQHGSSPASTMPKES